MTRKRPLTDQEDMLENIMRWLKVRWSERPGLSFAELLSEYCYAAVGHTDLSELSDDALLDVLKKGWRVT